MQRNPILVIDDDDDDLMLVMAAAEQLQLDRPIHFFKNGNALLAFLQESPLPPFLVLSDMNLPGETGFDIRKRVVEDPVLRYRSTPFIFWSTNASEEQIQHAYDLPAQGFFIKPGSFEEICDTFRLILGYWHKSQHPKRVS